MINYINKTVTVYCKERKEYRPGGAAKKSSTTTIPLRKYTFKVSSVVEDDIYIVFRDTAGKAYEFYANEVEVKVHNRIPRMKV